MPFLNASRQSIFLLIIIVLIVIFLNECDLRNYYEITHEGVLLLYAIQYRTTEMMYKTVQSNSYVSDM